MTNETVTVADEAVVVVDLFCGAGGSSTGAEQAITETGRKMELRPINHWAVAIRTHQLNHPKARHFIQDLEQADPETIVPEGYVDILLASPECRFSRPTDWDPGRGALIHHESQSMNGSRIRRVASRRYGRPIAIHRP